MTRDHSLIEELMAAEALGGLDDDDRELLERERASHGDCAECREIGSGFAETAGRLGFVLTPEPVDETMADRILASSRTATQEPSSSEAGPVVELGAQGLYKPGGESDAEGPAALEMKVRTRLEFEERVLLVGGRGEARRSIRLVREANALIEGQEPIRPSRTTMSAG